MYHSSADAYRYNTYNKSGAFALKMGKKEKKEKRVCRSVCMYVLYGHVGEGGKSFPPLPESPAFTVKKGYIDCMPRCRLV